MGPIATVLGVLISGLIAYWLFNKGIVKERMLYQEKRENERKYEQKKIENEKKDLQIKELENLQKFGKLLTTLIINVIDISSKQTGFYKKFAEEFLKDLLGQHFIEEICLENLNRLLTLDIDRILQYFEYKNLNNDDFISTLGQIDYLNEVFKRIPNDIHENNGKVVIELTNNLIAIRTKILKVCVGYLKNERKNNEQFQNNPLWTTINSIVVDYHKDNDGKPSADWDYKNLIIPIKEKLLVDQFRFDETCNELLDFAKTGGDIVFSIRQFNEELCRGLLRSIEQTEIALKKLKEVIDKLNYAP